MITRLLCVLVLTVLLAPSAQAQTCADVLPDSLTSAIATSDIKDVQEDRLLECVHMPTGRRWYLQYVGGQWMIVCRQKMEEVPGCMGRFITRRDTL